MALVYVIDDQKSTRDLFHRLLGREDFELKTFDGAEAAIEAARREEPDVVVTDLRMPKVDGIEALTRFSQEWPNVPIIMMTAYATVETAVHAMKRGAFDYVKKPFEPDEMTLAIRRALAHRAVLRENRELRTELRTRITFGDIVGRSKVMEDLFELLRKVAPSDATVLIEGESGTGKELIARAVHAASRRVNEPFLTVNCAAIPEALIEAELFGHEKGAYTGADHARAGYFAAASGGTLFLDEIGELALTLQPKLLRVLEEGEFTPVGSRVPQHADVRLIAATNRDLAALAAEGDFREDLYYRLNVFTVVAPALRDRREDIPLLIDHFVKKHAVRLGRPPALPGPEAMKAILEYPWPGNVRQLENAVQRALTLAEGNEIEVSNLPPEVLGTSIGSTFESRLGEMRLAVARAEFERLYYRTLLDLEGGNVTRAARRAGVHRATFYEKIARYGITTREEPGPEVGGMQK